MTGDAPSSKYFASAEQKRHAELWWATYNAAVTGWLASGKSSGETLHSTAVEIATRAHGAPR